MVNQKALKLLNILLSSRPEFNSKEEEEKWLKNIQDYCEISGIFDRTIYKSDIKKDKPLDLDYDKIFDV